MCLTLTVANKEKTKFTNLEHEGESRSSAVSSADRA